DARDARHGQRAGPLAARDRELATPLHPIGRMRGRSRRRMLDLHRPRRRAMTTKTLEELGPVDVVVIGYPAGAPMTGSAAELLLNEVDKGTIRVLDAMFVTKAPDGTFSGFDATGLEAGAVGDFHAFEG